MKTNLDPANSLSFQKLTIRKGTHRWGYAYDFNNYIINSTKQRLETLSKNADVQIRMRNFKELGFDIFVGKERNNVISRMFAFLFGHKNKIRKENMDCANDVRDLVLETVQKEKNKYFKTNK